MTRNGDGRATTGPPPKWLDHMKRGSALMRAGEAASAAAAFDCALRLRPGHAPTCRHLAAARLRAGDAAGALHLFDWLIARAPGGPEDLHGRGLALHALGRTEQAVLSFRAALSANPQSWRSAASIGDISPLEDERIEAIENCANILARLCDAAGTPELYEAAAGAFADAHHYPELLAFSRRYFGRFENLARAYDWLAKASYELGQFGEALAHKQAALDRTPLAACGSARRSAFDPHRALEAFSDVAEILAARGITCFPVAGTLLGLIRSGSPLTHDRDIDIGVFAAPGNQPDIAGLIRADPRVMLARGARPGDRYFALMHRATAIDIFVYDVSGRYACCGVSRRPGDIQWRFSRFSLREEVVAGRLWNLPHPADRYLAESYGEGWRMPDKGFASAIASPALFGVDVRVRAFYAAARARNALLSGDADKAQALARQSPIPLRLPAAVTGDARLPIRDIDSTSG